MDPKTAGPSYYQGPYQIQAGAQNSPVMDSPCYTLGPARQSFSLRIRPQYRYRNEMQQPFSYSQSTPYYAGTAYQTPSSCSPTPAPTPPPTLPPAPTPTPPAKQRPKKRSHAIKLIHPDTGDEIIVEHEGGSKNITPARSKESSTAETPEMDHLEIEELREMIRSLSTTLKCVVCLDILEKEVVLCVNGHAICKKCKGNQQVCPSCRDIFSNLKQTALIHQVLEIIPHTCKNKTCSYLVKSGDDHEDYCHLRPIKCKIERCAWVGPAVELGDHFKTQHGSQDMYTETNESVCIGNVALNGRWCVTLLFFAYGHYFWQLLNYNEGAGVLSFTYLPVFIRKPTHDVFMEIVFSSALKEYNAGLKIKMDPNNDAAKENCVYVPASILPNFYDKSQKEFRYSLLMYNS